MSESKVPSKILVALGLTGVAAKTACGPCLDYDTTTTGPCLQYTTSATSTAVCLDYTTGTGPTDTGDTTTTSACLTTTTGACLDYTTTGPCLDTTGTTDTGGKDTGGPDTGNPDTGGVVTVCLDYAISDTPDEPKAVPGADREQATRDVLERGVLPEDVAALLRHRLDTRPTE